MLHMSTICSVMENTRKVKREIAWFSMLTSAFASISCLTIPSPPAPTITAAINGVRPCSPSNTRHTQDTHPPPPPSQNVQTIHSKDQGGKRSREEGRKRSHPAICAVDVGLGPNQLPHHARSVFLNRQMKGALLTARVSSGSQSALGPHELPLTRQAMIHLERVPLPSTVTLHQAFQMPFRVSNRIGPYEFRGMDPCTERNKIILIDDRLAAPTSTRSLD